MVDVVVTSSHSEVKDVDLSPLKLYELIAFICDTK